MPQLVDPVFLALVAWLLALLLVRRFGRAALLLGSAGALGLYLLSTPYVAAALLAGLQGEVPGPAGPEMLQAEAIVVLGADLRHDTPEFGGDTVGALTLERIRYGAKLQRETGLPLLVTGGRIGRSERSVGEAMRLALEGDFRVEVHHVEGRSRNTFQNAALTAPILAEAGLSSIVLVTHAWHMPRAREAFEFHGLSVVAASTAFAFRTTGFWPQDWVPGSRALARSGLAIHEWVGRRWYQIRYYR